MNKVLSILFSILLINISYSQVTQEWDAIYNSSGNFQDQDQGIVVDAQGNVYVACQSSNYTATIIKYNSVGAEQWVIPFGTADTSYISSIEIDQSGNIYVTGGTGPNLNEIDLTTIKYNASGTPEWTNKYERVAEGDDRGLAIVLDQAGNIYVTGYSLDNNPPLTNQDYITIKYNSAGVMQWVEQYDGLGNFIDVATEITIDTQGNVYVSGDSYSGSTTSTLDYATIKYNNAGVQQWVRRYNGPASSEDHVYAIALDLNENILITGSSYGGTPTTQNMTTINYNPSGDSSWIRHYDAGGTDVAYNIAVDDSGNIYITGGSLGSGTNSDFATIKYNSSGTQQWVRNYNTPINNSFDIAYAITLDDYGNVYVTGRSKGSQSGVSSTTIKYNSDGDSLWLKSYNQTNQSGDVSYSIVVDDQQNVYVTGTTSISGPTGIDVATVKYSQGLTITSPLAGELWIAGETDTIRWTAGQAGQLLNIKYSTDNGNTYSTVNTGRPADSVYFVWNIPNGLLTTHAKIRIEVTTDTSLNAVSDDFKIKGYVLTRYSSNGNYDPYSKFRDPYTFGNDSSSLWHRSWWERFDYSGTDPFTSYNYLLGPLGLFLTANSSDFPDWVSWVRTFGVNACYFRTSFPPIYSPSAVLKWIGNADDWGGSCFGMSTSNALIFKNNAQFFTRFPSFPNNNPISISPTDTVKTVINELFTHQIGKEPLQFRSSIGLLKTPNETLRDIKKMLIDDNEPIRTLSITSNDPTDVGGHSILAFKVEQDTSVSYIFYVFVYDNAYPSNLDSAIIIIDTLSNNGNGTWSPIYAWQNWGGNNWFYLRDPATNYLTNPTLPKQQLQSSPFIIDENELQIYNTRAASILITDQLGNNSGYYNGVLINEIPDAFPNIIDNGSSGPPIGFDLPLANYSLTMTNYNDENSRISFFTGNKSFSYHRVDAQSAETDKLFFDGGVSYSNPDLIIKQINLISILNETTQEKAFAFNNVSMMQNDSVKLEYPDEDKIKLISYGSAKNYSLSIEFAKEIGYGSFENDNISLSINTSHTIVPNWSDINNSTLTILVDEGNNGTIDDTLYVDNTVDVEDQGSLLSPNSYNLAQNYPNPFNPTTTIHYSIPQRSHVTLKVYDILGNEVTTLVKEEKEKGVYTINFNASQLSSGMYLYRIQAGSFVETKKMILLK